MPHGGIGAWLAGPAALIVLLAIVSCVTLAAAGLGRLDRGAAAVEQARMRLEQQRALPMLWGLSAGVLAFAVCVLLVRIHALFLLALLLLLVSLTVIGLGLIVAAYALGGAIASAAGESPRPLASVRLGLTLLLLVSCLPYLGWLLTLLALAAGTGTVLEELLVRD